MTPEEQRKALLDDFEYLGSFLGIHVKSIHDAEVLLSKYRNVHAALSAPAVQQWQTIETAPVGSNEQKDSHVIGINTWGDVSRCYRIHNGSGPYALHNPWYNNYGQVFTPIGWMPLPAIDEVKE